MKVVPGGLVCSGACCHQRLFQALSKLIMRGYSLRHPIVQALLHAKEKADPQGWQQFQQKMQTLKLQRTRTMREAEDMLAALQASEAAGASAC